MRTRLTPIVARFVASTLALCVVGALVADGHADFPAPVVYRSEGKLVLPWIEVFFPEQLKPKGTRVQLVETGGTRRIPVRREPYYEDDQSLAGRARGRLVADQAYDVQILVPGQETIVLPAAFTARSPRFSVLHSTAASRGDVVYATVDFAPRVPRFRVNGTPARLMQQNSDGDFSFEVPRRLPQSVTSARVTATAFGRTLEAPASLTILPGRHTLSAVVEGERRTCPSQEWSESSGQVVIDGSRIVLNESRHAAISFVLWLPTTFDALQAPVTFTEADGARVQWGNTVDQGRAFPGEVGVFASTSCTITVDSIVGSRIRGTFSAHVLDRWTPGHEPDGRELDVTEGRFSVDLRPPASD